MAHGQFDHFDHTTATDPDTGETVSSYSLGSDLVITSHPRATQAPIVLTTQLDDTLHHGKPTTSRISYPGSYDISGHDARYFVICYANETTLSYIITTSPHSDTDDATSPAPKSHTIAYIADPRFFEDVDELPAVQTRTCLTAQVADACEQRELSGDIITLEPSLDASNDTATPDASDTPS